MKIFACGADFGFRRIVTVLRTNLFIITYLQNNKLPLHIVIFRDGVSESQFAKLVINDGMQVSVKVI